MTSPADEGYPATVTAVAGWLNTPEDAATERGHIAEAVAAVNAYVTSIHGSTDLPADVVQGAVMLAARITRRRNSPAGVEAFTELGPSYVSRYDVDIDRLLSTGAHRRLIVG